MKEIEWLWGPEECEGFRWEIAVEEDWHEYRIKNCYCRISDTCDCMSLEEFRDQKLRELENFWDYREDLHEKTQGECV